MLLLTSASAANASASVRFVHAVPGAASATLNVSVDGSGQSTAPVAFGEVSRAIELEAGDARLTVAPASGGDALTETEETLDDGASYTVVALPKRDGDAAELRVFADGKADTGKALLRTIHAAPELGKPDVRAGDRTVAEGLTYADATDYVDVPPGTTELSVSRAGGKGGPLATKQDVPLTAGSATTAVVVGSGGEEMRILALSDGTAAPTGAPETGLGGLAAEEDSGPSRLTVALLSALVAAGLGAAGWVLTGRR
jgi:hypothetical protein